MSDHLPTLVLPRTLEPSLGRGHFWVYRDHVPRSFEAASGSWVRVKAGRFVGYALWDPASPIALRVFSQRAQPDLAWVRERVRAAWELRQGVRDGHTNAFRWVAGEGDGLPGVVVDYYAGFVVLVTSSDALGPIVPWVVEALGEVTSLRGILRRRRHREGDQAETISGRAPPRELVVEEHGVRFLADLVSGQKTGLYLDQRENRQFVANLAAGRRMLNLFSYSGGFSVHAALAGASEVTSVDSAPAAMADARRNFELNGLDPEAHHFVVADVHEFLTSAKARGERLRPRGMRPAEPRAQEGAARGRGARLPAALHPVLGRDRAGRLRGPVELHGAGRSRALSRTRGRGGGAGRRGVPDHPRGGPAHRSPGFRPPPGVRGT